MEHLVLRLIQLVRALDQRSLRDLNEWVPDFQSVLNQPADGLRDRQIVIGPWRPYATRYGVIPLLGLLVLQCAGGVAILNDARDFIGAAVSGCVAVALAGFAGWLLWRCRGGRCVLHASGVDFSFRGRTVSCPWDLFHAAGQPIYAEEKRRLILPVARGAIGGVQLRRDGCVVAEGEDVRAAHFCFLPTGEVRLLVVYGVNPWQLGDFLLEVGRRIGAPESALPPKTTTQELPVATTPSQWMVVSLTRLRFPAECCDCMQPADRWQPFDYHFTLGEGGVQIQSPVCSVCQRANRRRYNRTFATIFAAMLVGGPLLSCLLGGLVEAIGVRGDAVFIYVIATLSVLLGSSWFVARGVARAVSTPLKLSGYRPGDGTLRIRFRNAKYTPLFIAAMDGKTASV